MNPNLKTIGGSVFIGIVLGTLLTISIQYPVTQEVVKSTAELCHTREFKKFKIGISGKVYEVTCSDGTTYLLK